MDKRHFLTPHPGNQWIDMIHLSIRLPFLQGVEFHKATVVTTVDTTTAPLSDVYFPSVTICNINQVRPQVLRSILCIEFC